jgi:hypothetical protein
MTSAGIVGLVLRAIPDGEVKVLAAEKRRKCTGQLAISIRLRYRHRYPTMRGLGKCESNAAVLVERDIT